MYRRCLATNSYSTGPVGRPITNNGIDPKFQLIYKPPNNGLLQAATSFCALNSLSCPMFLGMYLYDSISDHNTELVEQVSTLQLAGMSSAGFIGMIALYICYKIPMRIYNHQTEYAFSFEIFHLRLYFICCSFVFHSRYIAILPSIIPTVTRKFYFNKGDIVDKKPSKKAKKFLEKFLKPGFETVSFYKVKNKRLLLTIKCFQKPIQFFEMFANTEKYVRQVKRQSI